MTEEELLDEFKKKFERDCYDYSCEARDCIECSTFWDCFEEYKEDLGYMPSIRVGL